MVPTAPMEANVLRRNLTALLLMTVLIAACGDDDDVLRTTAPPPQSFNSSAAGFSFDYPAAWNEIPGLTVETQVGDVNTIDFVGVGNLDQTSGNLIGASVQADRITISIPQDEERAFLVTQFDPVMAQVAEAAQGTLTGSSDVTVAGHSARTYFIDSPVRGQDLTNRLTAFVIGDVLYKIQCQAPVQDFTPTERGCNLIQQSFTP